MRKLHPVSFDTYRIYPCNTGDTACPYGKTQKLPSFHVHAILISSFFSKYCSISSSVNIPIPAFRDRGTTSYFCQEDFLAKRKERAWNGCEAMRCDAMRSMAGILCLDTICSAFRVPVRLAPSYEAPPHVHGARADAATWLHAHCTTIRFEGVKATKRSSCRKKS